MRITYKKMKLLYRCNALHRLVCFPHYKGKFVFKRGCLTGWHLAITFFVWKLTLEASFHWLVRRRMNCPNPASSTASSGERALGRSWEAAALCQHQFWEVCLGLFLSMAKRPRGRGPPTVQMIVQDRLACHIRRSSQREVFKHLLWGQSIEQCLETP